MGRKGIDRWDHVAHSYCTMRKLYFLFLLLCIIASPAFAQTPVTATNGFAFSASPDHSATNADGSPMLTRYEIRFVPGTGCAPQPAVNAAKPTPDGTGTITVDPVATFGVLTANCAYTAVVAAIGPGGESLSAPTDPFWRVVLTAPRPAGKPAVVP